MDRQIKVILDKFSKRIIEKFIAKYDELGLRASGEFEEGLSAEIDNTTMIIWGAFHSQFMEKGRRSGGRPPIPSIMRWLETKKGLPPSMLKDKKRTAWAIATKIAKEGIKVPNEHNPGEVISMVVDEFLAKDVFDMLDELGVIARRNHQASIGELIAA
jgi:hypothetical protein